MQDREWLIKQIQSLPDKKNPVYVEEYSASVRIMPKGTPFPGAIDHDRTPFMKEFMGDFDETSDVETSVFMKPVQIAATWAIENVIVTIIGNALGPILYSTANEKLGGEWSEKRFDPMIEQAGLQDKIASQTERAHSKKTGDTKLLKEFPGGSLKITGYGSAGTLRSTSFRYFFADEIDEASADLKNQGSPLKLGLGRTAAYKANRKIGIFSSPTEEETSNVYKAYLLGDQRKYFVPCPYCGFSQVLDFHKGIVYELDEDRVLLPESVGYKCQNDKCGKIIRNYHKAEMLVKGKWVPTAKAKRLNYRSRTINSLYAPPGMITWSDIIQEYLDALDSGDPALMKTFENLYLGQPYKERGEAPDIQQVKSHRSNYLSGTVPDDVLYLTLGGDIQGDRIELEVLGHGRNYRTWSIQYFVIPGDTDSASAGAFAKFKEMFLNQEFIFSNERGKFAPQIGLIDSRFRGDAVKSFCEQCPGIYPSFGVDRFSTPSQRFKIDSTEINGLMSVKLATDLYKDRVYSSLRIDHPRGAEIPPNYPSFPADYQDSYFDMINSEYKRKKKVGDRVTYEYHCPNGKRNEGLDCRVYNICASEVIYFFAIKDVLGAQIEEIEKRAGRRATVREKMHIFYNHMEKHGVM